ncbi:FYN-binding protein 1 isoform X2 [Denticeps clupeoides]|uniref:SH3 domain-containing protein n=1 Tax=Denticeps clupeoides TaxID=299321 RepID=A0AAY4BZQ7_9TELE|nr:FYN-binding protein 1 isoform X2 [Denticeps clupeoides]
MEKTDVKSIMNRFNAPATEGTVQGGRPKVPLHPTLSSGPPVLGKKPVLETSLSGSAATNSSNPKISFLKNAANNTSEARENPKIKPVVNSTHEDTKPTFAKQLHLKPKVTESSQENEVQIPFLKPVGQKPSLGTTTDPKPVFPKLQPAGAKPPWVKDAAKSEESATAATPAPKIPVTPKPKSSVNIMRQQAEDVSSGDSTVKPFVKPPTSSTHTSTGKLSMLNKERGNAKTELGVKDGVKPPASTNSPSKPPTFLKPVVGKRPSVQGSQAVSDDPSAPPKNPLPNIFALGSPPAKPNRPPKVDLEKFKKGTESVNEGVQGVAKVSSPPSIPSSQPPTGGPPALPSTLPPSLPPRPSPGMIQPEQNENSDDVKLLISGPSRKKESDSDDETYEDVMESGSHANLREEDKKREKEEKKRIEQEKKDQKERERKEQDARKRFKLVGPVQVIHKVKVPADCKGSKNELSIKQGDSIEIIRITDNPEGRWLGRTQDGTYGYVKTDSVTIDFDSLKQLPSQTDYEPDLYDDIGNDNSSSEINVRGVVLPPPPEEDDDLYDDLDDPSLAVSVPPPPQFTPDTDQSAAHIDDDIYDDVDSKEGFPPPPPLSSLPQLKSKPKADEKDPKKQKKLEKEEKEFRKKFKFDGEIRVLYQVTIVLTLSTKKWGSKDLPLIPGEILDVILKAVDNRLICRNTEGKFGYVSISNIVDDADIYDDIGNDCIYDND